MARLSRSTKMLSVPRREPRHVFLSWYLYVVAASVCQRKRERTRERRRERVSARRCRYLSATFLYCKRQGPLKVNLADRAEATCSGNLTAKIPRSMYKRKLHSKFLAAPIRKLFFFSVTFSFFLFRASSPATTQPTCPSYHSRYTFRTAGREGRGHRDPREVTFRGLVSCAPLRN
jgi:hypothetical protein